MGRKKTAIIIVGISLAFINLLPEVLADSGHDTIHEDQYSVHHISSPTEADSMTLSYTVEITSGPYIDVYFMTYENFEHYKIGESFSYITQGTQLNTKYTSKSFKLYKQAEPQLYCIVFDNTDVGTEPPWNMVDDIAEVSWTIKTVGHTGGGGGGIPAFELSLVVIAVSTILLLRKRTDKN